MSESKKIIISISLVLFSMAIFVALFSFNQADPSIIHKTTESVATMNWLGWLGANLAGVLLFYFGFSALLFIPILLISAYFVHKTEAFQDNVDRFISVILIMPVSSAISCLYCFEFFGGVSPGGTVGIGFSNFLNSFLELSHVYAFLFILFWALSIIIYRFSFVHLVLPVCKLFYIIPYATIWGYFVRYATIVAMAIKSAFVRCVDALTQDLAQEDCAVDKIYKDPFWALYANDEVVSDSELGPQEEFLSEDLEDSIEESLDDGSEVALEKDLEYDLEDDFEDSVKDDFEDDFEGDFQDIDYVLPNNAIFSTSDHSLDEFQKQESEMRSTILEDKLMRFGIQGKVTSIVNGPVVTLFEYHPSVETKISNILARENDLALALQALSLRIIAPIPGRSVVGFEVAHSKRRSVLFGELSSSKEFKNFKGELPLILGKDTLGNNVIIDLVSTPHLLVAGSTGSGKSVGLNAMLISLLCSKSPEELKLILIDPKRLEFASYHDIAHLLFPIVTEAAKAILVLKWAVKTMEDRYNIMSKVGVRNIYEYRALYPEKKDQMPYILIMIDELADLMMTAGKDVEYLIARLAQMARAAGIHMVIATQRPSVDIITGLIKVNFPSRVAFKVTSKIDSRTILDEMGAEKLLGKGDMLFLDSKGSLCRVHGAYVTDEEIFKVVEHIKEQRPAGYEELQIMKVDDSGSFDDDLFDEVIEYVRNKDEISISQIQRVFRIGYNRSARIVEQLEVSGHILPSDGSKMRKVFKEDSM